jgi:hypothetical protein
MVFFFEKILENCCFYKKKKSHEFYFHTKQKKSNPACIFLYFHFIFTSFTFFEKNTENYSVKFLHQFFFGVKKHFRLHQLFFRNTAQCFFKTPIFILQCIVQVFGNCRCTSECKCKCKKKTLHCVVLFCKNGSDHLVVLSQ